ncbi:hypothetical protein AB0B82_35350, partial [Kribbella sp. NPDC048915]
IWVRAAAGAVIRFDATIDDLARALKALGDTDSLNQRRAKAIDWIADPAAAHQLIEVARHLATTQATQATQDPTDAPETAAPTHTPDPADAPNPPRTPDMHGTPGATGTPPGSGGIGEPADDECARLEEAYLMESHGWEPMSTDTSWQPPLDDTFATTQPAPPQKPSHTSDCDTARDTDCDTGCDTDCDTDWGIDWGIDWDADQDKDPEVGPVGPVGAGGAGGAADACAPVDEDTFTRRGLAATLAARLAAIKHDAHRTGLGAGSTGRGRARHTLYVHLTDLTLATGTGVLRVEELGPQLATQLAELLGHDHFVVKPVIDLHDQVSVHSYEIPDRIRERVRLRHPVDMFPYSGAEATVRMDQDHITPYDHTRTRDHGADPEPPPSDQPGQTSVDNLIPQGRLHHRAKTFGGWHNRRLPTGAVAWTSPHGFRFVVDHTGTHQLPRNRTG